MANQMKGLPTADPYLPEHGDPSYAVQHYGLDLAVALGGNRLDGTASVDLIVLEATSRLVFDLAHLRAAKVKGSVGVKGFRQSGHRLVVDLKTTATAGTQLHLEISYSGRPRQLRARHHGLAGWEELEDGIIMAAQPHGAPTWFPCNDRMSEKSTYTITVRTDVGYRAVSNGVLVAQQRQGSSQSWSYRLDQAVAPYLATVQIGRYLPWSVPSPAAVSVPIEVLAPVDLSASVCADSFARQGEMMQVYCDLFGAYPFAEYRSVVTDDDLEIPLESASLSTFGRNFAATGWETERLIAHELSHQWFGNSVTAQSMQHIWLHEGFACYAEWLWSERSGRRSADQWARVHHERLTPPPVGAILADPGPDQMFEDWVYKRGALTLHTLRLRIGDEAFMALLQGWASKYSGQTVSTDDFLAFADQQCQADVSTLLRPWLFEHALPALPVA